MFINTYRYYVYSTSKTAATYLAEKVLAGEKRPVQKYLDFLSAGGSDYPIDVLKKAGVDLTSSEPFEKTMEAMVQTMNEIEEIISVTSSPNTPHTEEPLKDNQIQAYQKLLD